MNPKPILVLGVNRSGTKWLCNEISRHPDVVSIAHEVHGGILETNLLGAHGRSFDFNTDAGYQAFLDFWTRTHFFSLAGARREDFEGSSRPAGPVEAFRHLMDEYATRRGARFWVQKVQPFHTAFVLERMPDALLVRIDRSLEDAVRSRLKLDQKRGMPTTSFRAAVSISLQKRELDRVCSSRHVHAVAFDALRADPEVTLRSLMDFVGLKEAVLGPRLYDKNTSFGDERERVEAMGARELAIVRAVAFLVKLSPYRVLRAIRNRLTRADNDPLPGTFAQTEEGFPPDVSAP